MSKKWYNRKLIITLIILLFFCNYQTILAKTLPYSNQYTLGNQSWTFIQVDELNASIVLQFNWSSSISVQGRAVSEDDFDTLIEMDLISRSAYFEELTFTEGLVDSGTLNSNENGEIFFVFFNPNTQDAILGLYIDENQSNLSPWAIGIITTIVAALVLTIAVLITKRIRDSMLEEQEEAELTPEQRYLQ